MEKTEEKKAADGPHFYNGSVLVGESGEKIECLTVIGQVEGHYLLGEREKATRYEHLIPQLVAAEESREVRGVLVILNTMGGDVEAGLALSELIASLHKPTATLVLGGGHSIGVPLAVSGKRSFIVPSATMTLHPVRVNGTVIGAPQTFRYFRDMQDRISDFICAHSGIAREKLTELMLRPDDLMGDVGTLLCGREAVELGLIDEIGGISAAMDYLKNASAEPKPETGAL